MDKESLEKIIPAGLSGPIREKAMDAAALATSLLHMSAHDVVDRVAEIAKEHGIDPASGRTWMLFYKDVNERIKTSKEIIGVAQEPGAQVLGIGREADQYRARRANERSAAHHVPLPSITIPGVTGVAYMAATEEAGDLGKGARKLFSEEVGSHGNSQSGRNGVYSWDQLATGWRGREHAEGHDVGPVEFEGNDAKRDPALDPVADVKGRHHENHAAAAHCRVETLHRKAAMQLKDRDYIGFRTFMENAHLLDAEHKGRGKSNGTQVPAEQERIATHLKTNLLYVDEDAARGAQPDIMKAIRNLHNLPDPEPLGLDARARDRMDKSMGRLTGDYRDWKKANREKSQAQKEKKAARVAGKKRGGPER